MEYSNQSIVRTAKLHRITAWAEENHDIRVVLLTSSLVNPMAPVDDFSDLDIEFVFENNAHYVTDAEWVKTFGRPIAMVEEDDSYFDHKHAMKMVLYDDQVKVDFKLYSKAKFLEEAKQDVLPEDWDIGYRVLVDKDQLTHQLKKPTYQVSIITRPTEQQFRQVLNDFWWDTTYVAKCLARDELFFAKFMSENNIRTGYLLPLIEWKIASEHNWSITTNKYGRLFKKYLSPALWRKIEHTFAGSSVEDNWDALFAMAGLVNELGVELAGKLGYPYPYQLEKDIRQYLSAIKQKNID
ncbi:AadS family aminoglycoside 6-adenylyltransferase [Parapedobacter lycopersici]|uniref:AadS family aminoglycoside 6-adenylyltransferase n=1 Tax=Parapedobacter lycopersici TaxID=1864939 RepID=UPI00214DD187|nr:AadS family aminoglycoside 6-adenylyltransferase [Parapedobacter lycopersici]